MIFDKRDEQLNGFVEKQFNKLEQLLKENVNVIGPALLWGDVSLIDNYLKQGINDFAKDYKIERSNLSVGELLNDVPKMTKLKVNDELAEKMKEKIDSLVKLLNF